MKDNKNFWRIIYPRGLSWEREKNTGLKGKETTSSLSAYADLGTRGPCFRPQHFTSPQLKPSSVCTPLWQVVCSVKKMCPVRTSTHHTYPSSQDHILVSWGFEILATEWIQLLASFLGLIRPFAWVFEPKDRLCEQVHP